MCCFGRKNRRPQVPEKRPRHPRPANCGSRTSLRNYVQIIGILSQVEYIELREVRDDLPFTSKEDDKFRTFKTHLHADDYFKSLTFLATEPKVVKNRKCALIRVGSEKDALAMHRELSKTRWRERYRQELSICYKLEIGVRFRGLSFSDANADDNEFPEDSLCGQLASVRDSGECVTIGGIVKQDGNLWALTAQHDRTRNLRPETGRGEPPPSGGPPPSGKASDYPPIDELEPAWIIRAPMGRYAAPEPSTSPRRPGQLSSRRPGQLPLLKLDNKKILSGGEWALAPIDDPELYLPNRFTIDSPRPPLPLTTIASAPRAGPVLILGGVSGNHTMMMLSFETDLRTSSGSWCRTWSLQPHGKSTIDIQDGDSGSWVVDPDGGTVYGMVVASLPDTVYVLPLRDVRVNGRGIELANDDEIEAVRMLRQMQLAERVLAESRRLYAAAKEVHDASSAAQQRSGSEEAGRVPPREGRARRRGRQRAR